MNLIDRSIRWLVKRSGLANPERWLSEMLGGRALTESGANVTERTAMQCAAVLSCTRIVSETIASLPLKVYKRLPNGGKEPAFDHPLYDVLGLNPNPDNTSFEWRESLAVEACIWGNHYAQQVLDGKGNVRELWPLDPGRMAVDRPDYQGARRYTYTKPDGTKREFAAAEILHVSLYGNGLKGYSLIDLCREAVGLSMSAEQFASRFFKNDAAPRLVMQTDQSLSGKTVDEMRTGWNKAHQGTEKAHQVGWVWGGMKPILLEADLSKLQLLDVRKFQLEEIARIFRVPLHLIQSLDRSTNNNIEHQGIDFVVHTIRPWLVRIEQRISKSLFGPVESSRYFAEFNVDGLQRGDYASRTTGYAKLIAAGVMTPNEARALENMNPIEGGDRLYIQGAMVPLEMAGKGVASETTKAA